MIKSKKAKEFIDEWKFLDFQGMETMYVREVEMAIDIAESEAQSSPSRSQEGDKPNPESELYSEEQCVEAFAHIIYEQGFEDYFDCNALQNRFISALKSLKQ